MLSRIKRTRPTEEDDEDVGQETESSSVGETEKANLDRIEQRYRDRADSPLRAIRAFCVLCMGCQPRMVAECSATNCVLYPFRFGKNPHQRHTKKRGSLKSIAKEDDDGSTSATPSSPQDTATAKRFGRSRGKGKADTQVRDR